MGIMEGGTASTNYDMPNMNKDMKINISIFLRH